MQALEETTLMLAPDPVDISLIRLTSPGNCCRMMLGLMSDKLVKCAQEDQDVWQDDATAEAETSISAASEVQAGTETALHVGGAVAKGQQITSEPGKNLPGV